ncbi:MAG: hypothetical protein CVU55_06205 [Deltaproteobacteria bacterium HGW-Deltaproteobacteria-13]|jgi:quercetin dioxygenase-like cupin family protein|nr:MAG: hypothetical protein CVU55_06205 [Deltaproteobacteria bacterium HGW-Deltaproteobacteria-13]
MLTANKIKRSKVRQWLANPILQAKYYWMKAAKIVRSFYMDSEESDQQKLQGDGIAVNSSAGGIYPLSIPLPPDEETGFRPYPIFSTEAMNVSLASHVSVLTKGHSPHPPHTHDEEEILVLLAGEVDLILPDLQSADDGNRVRLSANQCVYYPADFPHTLQTVSETPANYLMFKWKADGMKSEPALSFGLYNIIESNRTLLTEEGFRPHLLFQGPTKYLKKLRCHFSTLTPGAGYDPHADPYCVAIIVLEGEVETLGKRVRPHGVIFYGEGELHGMDNHGAMTARYVVFEFHG